METCCEFSSTADGIYSCSIKSQTIFEGMELKFIGNHKEGKNDNNVGVISFYKCVITKVPQGLTKTFPNLSALQVKESNLKNISRSDLIEYKNIKKLDFDVNKIEFLPGDLVEGFRNLEEITFRSNKLNIVEPNIFDGLENLKNVSFNGNVDYTSLFTFNNNNMSLEKIKASLLDIYFKKDVQILKEFSTNQQIKIQIVKKINDNLSRENIEIYQKCQNLEQTNEKLSEENEHLKADNENLTKENQVLKENDEAVKQENKNLKDELEIKTLRKPEIYENFSSAIKTFIQDETTKDFRIQIDDREFPVHKFLLAARSPTFAEILRNNPEVENLNLVDISVEIFEKILKFLYTDELPREEGTNFLLLFAAAGRLKIEELKNFAAVQLIDIIDGENALETLNLSNKYGHDELRQKCFYEIKKNYPKVDIKDEWITDGEKVEKLINFFKKMEQVERSLEDLMT